MKLLTSKEQELLYRDLEKEVLEKTLNKLKFKFKFSEKGQRKIRDLDKVAISYAGGISTSLIITLTLYANEYSVFVEVTGEKVKVITTSDNWDRLELALFNSLSKRD